MPAPSLRAPLSGFSAPWAGVRFIRRNPSLLRFFAIPVLINTLVYGTGGYLFFSYLPRLMNSFIKDPQTWYMELVWWVLAVIIGGVVALIFLFTFTAVGLVIASPFLEALSEKVDIIRLGGNPAPDDTGFITDILRSMASMGKWIFLFLLAQILCLFLHLIPVIGNIVGAACQFGVTFFFLAWEFWDIPMERRKMKFGDKWKFMKDNLTTALAFGAVISLYILIPLFNFVMMPTTVAGASILVSQLLGEQPLSGDDPQADKILEDAERLKP
ncbi:MAG: EI24 domain-containing protein [Deltaproteobacteria bacterium]|nr:EI24 domain-containing protein [Deltaproteobacteria bacterium]MCB9487715.1 EI24 domain-containing protein [Deltaproteobacteria bacterium]